MTSGFGENGRGFNENRSTQQNRFDPSSMMIVQTRSSSPDRKLNALHRVGHRNLVLTLIREPAEPL
jgi:hypothetical protein